VFGLGLGPKPIMRGKLKVQKLQDGILQALNDTRMRSKAAEPGANIRSEPDGITIAVSMIEELL
jgi:hypothetical protein